MGARRVRFFGPLVIGATLCATSVGITARVLQDIQKIRSREARIILGAAVIDDILGLIILAIVSGMILGASAGLPPSMGSIVWLVTKVVIFLAVSLTVGIFLIPRIFRQAAKTKMKGMLFSLSLAFCFLLAYLNTLIDLAPIVGASAAGLILEGVLFEEYRHALERDLNRLSIGIGMVPRGEVGLIFAGVGLTLSIGGERIIDEAIFAAILVMVMVTTLMVPSLLQWSFARSNKRGRMA